MSKVIGYRIGNFEGEKRDTYKPPADAGTKPVPSWHLTEFQEHISGILNGTWKVPDELKYKSKFTIRTKKGDNLLK